MSVDRISTLHHIYEPIFRKIVKTNTKHPSVIKYKEVKPYCFHGLKQKDINIVLKEGLFPTGGVYGTGVYTKQTARKTILDYYDHDALICIYLPHNRHKAMIPYKKRDWILFNS